MKRMEAISRKARALWFEFSQSLLRRRRRVQPGECALDHPAFGQPAKPLAWSERLTISTWTFASTFLMALRNLGP